MGLIRLITFALVIWLFWRVVKNFKASQLAKNEKSRKEQTSLKQSNMVLCHYCSVHVPEGDAVNHNKLWFCSDKHKQKFLTEDKK